MKDSEPKKVVINQPTWMSIKQWRELLALNGGSPQCAYTKKTAHEAKLVVDHIVPLAKGGQNEVSNYQFLCEEENRKKWAKPDQYWAEDYFYYDLCHDPKGFRYAQDSLAYRQILANAPHFQRPWSQINRIVHLLAWITGAGKTMAIHAICFALNQILRRDKGVAYPRVNRILVLVKEQALRDQLEKELAEDVVKYGICATSPRVGVVEESGQLENDYWLEQQDIVVSCLQQVWERDKGIPRDKIEPILGKFAVIFFDEPHFAVEQVAKLAESATRSLCFGLTSTPINAEGKILESYVLFSLLGYREASQEQKNLKYLSSSPGSMTESKLIETVREVEAREFFSGDRTEIEGSPDTEGYNMQLEPAKTVAEKVVSYVVESDRLCQKIFLGEITPEPAPHRNEEEVMADLIYPMHAMISVRKKHDADVLQKHLEKLFSSNPQEYPQEQGFIAEVVYSGGEEDENGKAVKGQKLHTKHPWLKCWRSKDFQMKKSGWKLPEKCARFLIVVDMAREGINNPFCGVIGLGRRTQSIIEVIQRLIGRQIRSYTEPFLSTLKVPPAQLDTIKIWTHAAWNYPQPGGFKDNATENRILDGLKFCEYMDEWLAGLTTLEDLIENGKKIDGVADITDKAPLMSHEKLGIAFDIGTYQLKKEAIAEDNIINRWCGGIAEKRELGKEWLNLVKKDPETAQTELVLNIGKLRKRHIIEHERPKVNPSIEDLRCYCQLHDPKSLPSVEKLDDPATDDTLKALLRPPLENGYNLYMKGFHRFSYLPPVTDFQKIRTGLVRKLSSQLGYNTYSNETGVLQGDNKEIEKMVHSQIGFAVKTVLGLEKAGKGSEHDIPQYHAVLSDPSVVRDILGYAKRKLLQKFSLPLVTSLQIVDRSNDGE